MSDFITDVEQQYEVYCKIAEEHGFIDLNAKKNGFRCTTKLNEFNAGWIAFTGAVAAVRDEQQAIIDNLKTQLNNMEQCYIQLKQINNEQAEIIRGHFFARQEMKKCIDAALYDIAQAKDGFYGYSSDGGDVDNLAKNIEKSLRGER